MQVKTKHHCGIKYVLQGIYYHYYLEIILGDVVVQAGNSNFDSGLHTVNKCVHEELNRTSVTDKKLEV